VCVEEVTTSRLFSESKVQDLLGRSMAQVLFELLGPGHHVSQNECLRRPEWQQVVQRAEIDPCAPCPYKRGTFGRVLWYHARYRAGLDLWNPKDNPERIVSPGEMEGIQSQTFQPLTSRFLTGSWHSAWIPDARD